MLTRTSRNRTEEGPTDSIRGPARKARNPGRERRLWHQPERPMTEPLGCRVCPDRALCGGLRPEVDFYDCLQFCCGSPGTCDRVCRRHPDFADRVREVGTFALDTVPRGPFLTAPALPAVVPVVYHSARRVLPVCSGAVAIPLYAMFDRRDGAPRYSAPAHLRDAFGIGPDTAIVLTGTDRDQPLERWWAVGKLRRRAVIDAMKATGVGIVTTPNYSLFINRPRWDDLHAMKRIAIVHAEFLNEGMPAALHVNGRTEADFSRWRAYIATRPEITHIAYEFTTGTGWPGRRGQHAAWLAGLVSGVDRPLHLIVRGGVELLPMLARAFAGVTVLETTTFMKTMMRQSAYPKSNAVLGWRPSPTIAGAPVDNLFAANREAREAWLRAVISAPKDRPLSG